MLASSLRAAGDARFTMIVSLTAMFIFRIPAAYLFAVVLDFGVMGVMMAMGVDWFYRFTINQIRLKGDKWLTSVV